VPDKIDSAVQNLVRADQLGQRLAQLPGRAGGQPAGNAIFGRVAWRVTDPSRIGLQQGHDGVVSSGGSALHDWGGDAADPLDLDFDHVAGVQEHRWYPGGPDAVGRAGSDEVAGLERHHTRRVRCDLGA
jgi:hypothetical protein